MTGQSPWPVMGVGIKSKRKTKKKHSLQALGKAFLPNKRNLDMTEQLN